MDTSIVPGRRGPSVHVCSLARHRHIPLILYHTPTSRLHSGEHRSCHCQLLNVAQVPPPPQPHSREQTGCLPRCSRSRSLPHSSCSICRNLSPALILAARDRTSDGQQALPHHQLSRSCCARNQRRARFTSTSCTPLLAPVCPVALQSVRS